MAVIDGIKGLTVTVLVDGEVAQEYPAPDAAVPDNLVFHDPIGLDSDPYVVHYIEAIPDRPFSVQVERLPSFQHVGHHIGYTFQIDDVVVRMSHDTSGRHSTWTGSSARFITKRPDGKLEYQSYRFAPIEICEASKFSKDDIQRQISDAKNMGLIRLKFFHLKESESQVVDVGPQVDAKPTELAEKALKGKAVDTQVSYQNEPCPLKYIQCYENRYVDRQKRPFAVFDFLYRTMDADLFPHAAWSTLHQGLYKEGIVERPRTPDPIDAMSEEDVRRLARELLEKKQAEEQARVKIEGRGGRALKRERAETMSDAEFLQRYKGRRMDGGKIEIDLTDD